MIFTATTTGLQVQNEGIGLLSSPPEGLWSVAMGWQDGWPTDWCHAQPETVRQLGPWTVLAGTVRTPQGDWRVEDAWRCERAGAVWHCLRTWRWTGSAPASHCTLAVCFLTPAAGRRVLLPGCLYYGNPSGARSERTPGFGGEVGERAFFEEHRLPLPFVVAEVPFAGQVAGVALHSLPSPAPGGQRADQWWSLGVESRADGTALALLSGPCASNGRNSVIKASQERWEAYDDAWLRLPPGAVIRKEFAVEVATDLPRGSGFRPAVQTSLARLAPFSLDGLPSLADIVRAKARFALTRWHEDEVSCGFRKYPDRRFIVMGWCGQAAAPGYALPVLAPLLGLSGLGDKAQRALDFLASAAFHDAGFHTWYNIDARRWENIEVLSEGQAMLNLFRALAATSRTGLDGRRWEEFLRRACGLHARRILAPAWRPVSTNEGFLVAPLCAAAARFGDATLRQAALKAGEHYRERHLSMDEPYWGGTLDARCEDKEGAFAAMQAFLALFDLTAERSWLDAAAHAMDVALTYCVAWDIPLPPGPLADRALKTRGWTAVSVQNMHLDVYGVLFAPDVYRLGGLTGRPDLQRLALVMFRSCGQLIDATGSQGEQIEQTNYTQQHSGFGPGGWRGGYSEHWTVFWITAHFLTAAAQFAELGVRLE
jgi:hypothetical protein